MLGKWRSVWSLIMNNIHGHPTWHAGRRKSKKGRGSRRSTLQWRGHDPSAWLKALTAMRICTGWLAGSSRDEARALSPFPATSSAYFLSRSLTLLLLLRGWLQTPRLTPLRTQNAKWLTAMPLIIVPFRWSLVCGWSFLLMKQCIPWPHLLSRPHSSLPHLGCGSQTEGGLWFLL